MSNISYPMDLDEEQQDAFLDGFYAEWERRWPGPPDYLSPVPWGRIWLYDNELAIDSTSLQTIEDAGVAYFHECEPEIRRILEEEEQERENAYK